MSSVKGLKDIGNVVSVPLSRLSIDPTFNFRAAFDPATDADDAALLNSLKRRGYEGPPMVVRFTPDGVIPVVEGHRRFAAMTALVADKVREFPGVPCVAEPAGTKPDARVWSQIRGNMGKAYGPAEMGAVYEFLAQSNWKVADIAAEHGKTVKWVSECRRAAKLDNRLQAMIKAGLVSATLALETVTQHGADKAADLIADAARNAPKTGGKKGKATGAGVRKAAAKQGVRHKAKNLVSAPVVPPKGKNSYAAMFACLSGPFKQGKGDDDCDILDAENVVLCEMASAEQARGFVALANQGWHTFKGGAIPTGPLTVGGKAPTGDKAPRKSKATTPAPAVSPNASKPGKGKHAHVVH